MNYYQILQVEQTATQQEIKQAYRRLVKKFHPDSQHQDANHEQIVEINAAYEVLGDFKTRRHYDSQLAGFCPDSPNQRHDRETAACQHYRQNREQKRKNAIDEALWLEDVYSPLNRLISRILIPLDQEIEELSADPFDEELMSVFENYLLNCRNYFNKARKTLTSQPNPAQYAHIAANLYYCLNHISDGIEELERFTQTYNYDYLNRGKELFRIAYRVNLV